MREAARSRLEGNALAASAERAKLRAMMRAMMRAARVHIRSKRR